MPVRSGRRSGRGFSIGVAGSMAALALFVAGCADSVGAKSHVEVRQPPQTAPEVLERMVEAYHHAESYQDSGRLLVRYTRDGEAVDESSEFSLALAAPNRLRMRAYDALAICDGQNFRAMIDEAPGEVLSVPAPEELSPGFIDRDLVLSKARNQIVGSVPLWLFLAPDPLPDLQLNGEAPQLDPPAKIGADDCYRVRVDRREGPFVLWIDQRSFVVRRVEYPTSGYRRLIEPYIGPVSDMTIIAELEGALLDGPVDDARFEFDAPPGAELVKRFDAVGLGARIPKFKLRGLDGRQITRDSLAGKVAVLRFWHKGDVFDHYRDLAGFEQLMRRFHDQDSVAFLAVSADPDQVSDDELRAELAKAELNLPVARISRHAAIRSFGLHSVPATVILGRDGKLQELLMGPYPNQLTALPKRIDTILAGGDLSLEASSASRDAVFYAGFGWQNPQASEEEQQLQQQQQQSSTMAPALVKVDIAPASEPEFLRRKRLWTSTEPRRPGNMIAAPGEAGGDRVFVIERLPYVVELDAAGKIAARHRLDLPDRDDAEVTFLRTAADKAGARYFLGSSNGGQQAHLYDDHWKRLLSFPEAGDHPGIADAALADLNGDGQLEMVIGYVTAVGVHCVALDGQRLWRNRAAEVVFRLDVTAPDRDGQRQVLVADGLTLPIDAAGHELPPIVLPDALTRLIFTSDFAPGRGSQQWLAVALKWQGQAFGNVAVGLSPRGQELWRYPLPDGTHQHPAFEMVASGDLLGGDEAGATAPVASGGQWVIAASDGSMHIIGFDGTLVDRFCLGAAPSGMTIARLDGRSALLVATDEGVTAWQFEMPEPAAEQK